MAPLSNGSTSSPSFLVIGAGSRGQSYARAVSDFGIGQIACVAEPIAFQRKQFGEKYIWHQSNPSPGQQFENWKQYVDYELKRREDEASGEQVPTGVDAVFICVRDEHHKSCLESLAPLGLHIMCEKPLATSLQDCIQIDSSLRAYPERIFGIGHVLHYSPHNLKLYDLLREQRLIGDIISMEHTEPVGAIHFSHSYVRGNWRKESVTAPSLLTKSCHDIDFILWMLCSAPSGSKQKAHLPSRLTSMGALKQFRKVHKPKEAGNATNCMSCPIKDSCIYSAPRIYYDKQLAKSNANWPVSIVNPKIESILATSGFEKAKDALFQTLSEDYDAQTTPIQDIEDRSWYGRCVWESDNDVCDDQYVTIEWEDDPEPTTGLQNRSAKTATFHMIAQTLAQCERRGRIYGTTGEIYYDSSSITVNDFTNDSTKTYNPEVPAKSHHGGGDDGLTQQFVKAVIAVKEGQMSVQDAQVEYIGVTMEDIIRSHAAVFAAEDARRQKKVVEWKQWWEENVSAKQIN